MQDWQDIRNPKEKYAAYLCSREWGLLREAVHDRADGMCERCKIQRGYAVHHLTYIRKYRENLEDLRLLCNDCHEFVHGRGDVDHNAKTHLKVYLAGSVFQTDKRADQVELILFNFGLYDCFPGEADVDYDALGYPPYRELGREFGSEESDSDAIEFHSDVIDDWRREIFSDIYDNLHKVSTVENASLVETKNFHFEYVGPTISFDHGCYGNLELAKTCLDEVEEADIVFAWIDNDETIGTLVEIGAAYAMGKRVYVAFSSAELRTRFYFVSQLSRKFINAKNSFNEGIVAASPLIAFWAMVEAEDERAN